MWCNSDIEIFVMAGCSDANPDLCAGCQHSLRSFIDLSACEEDLLHFLYSHGVLLRTKKCPDCDHFMTLDESAHSFRCYKWAVQINKHKKKVKVQCRKYISQYKNTWFENHNLDKRTICLFVAYWGLLRPPRHELLINELNITDKVVVDWSNNLRELCEVAIAKNSQAIGGPGKIVELYEAEIRKRKYNRGQIIEGSWVFGGIEQDSKKCFLVPVAARGHETLLSTIKNYILPGTTIISDCWKTYNCLQLEHLTVNKTYSFVDPDSNAQIQNIGSLWREVRGNIPRFGYKEPHLVGHLAEFMFKRLCGSYKERIHHLFLEIGKIYDGNPSADPLQTDAEYTNSDTDIEEY